LLWRDPKASGVVLGAITGIYLFYCMAGSPVMMALYAVALGCVATVLWGLVASVSGR
jgi:hypothetical protein